MSFFKGVKNAGIKAKLKGEIVFLDRERKARIRQFGVELHDKIVAVEQQGASKMVKMPAVFRSIESKISEPLEKIRCDMQSMEADLLILEEDIEKVQVAGARAPPALTAKEKASKAGKYLSDTGKEAQMQVKVKMLKRKMQQRKEEFGLEVFDLVEASGKDVKTTSSAKSDAKANSNGGTFGMGQLTSELSKGLSKLSSSESEIQACIDLAKKDVAGIDFRKEKKEREIANIDAGVL